MQSIIQNIVKQHLQREKHIENDTYQMKCLDCPLKYLGQTDRAFCTKYKEHIQAVIYSNNNSGYSNSTLNTGQKYRTITDTMNIIMTLAS
jgi:hypothetical protein